MVTDQDVREERTSRYRLIVGILGPSSSVLYSPSSVCLFCVCVVFSSYIPLCLAPSIVRLSYDVHTSIAFGFVVCLFTFFSFTSPPCGILFSPYLPCLFFLHYLWSTKAVLHPRCPRCVLATTVAPLSPFRYVVVIFFFSPFDSMLSWCASLPCPFLFVSPPPFCFFLCHACFACLAGRLICVVRVHE